MDTRNNTVITTEGKEFSWKEHQELARLIYRRFGRDLSAATEAWCRLLQNSTTEKDFLELLG